MVSSTSFRSYSHAKRGASPLRLPPAGLVSSELRRLTAVLARNQAWPAATRALMLLLPLVGTCGHPFENRDFRLVSHQLLGVADDRAHECKGGAMPGLTRLCCSVIG